MGTDIHFAVERLSEAGRWTWTGLKVNNNRNYDLFAILADVRNGHGFAGIQTGHGFAPISKPRGFPADIDPESVRTDFDWENESEWGVRADGEHTPSWLLLSEILNYDYEQKTLKTGLLSEKEYAAFRRGEPHGYCGGISGPKVVILAEGEYAMLGKTARTRRFSDKEYYVRAYWEATYAECLGDWLDQLRKLLAPLGDPKKVRLIFNFDS